MVGASEGLTVSVVAGKSREKTTEISGRLPDQAALIGVLDQLYDCGIPLLSVQCVTSGSCEG